jgi:DNA invertase Pin-like site-specific DNA recombinase
MNPLVCYYRVSSQRQGRSGLGLEAQRAAVLAYAQRCQGQIIAEFRETESGGQRDRPELAKAVRRARLSGATLVVAKLDRLARDVRLILELRDSGLSLHFCDLPELGTHDPAAAQMILTIMAAFAEFERGRGSERCRAVRAEQRKRGVKLGSANPKSPGFLKNGKQKLGTVAAAQARTKRAQEFRALMRPVLDELQAGGLVTLAQLAEALNQQGYRTRTGRMWTPAHVHALLRED